MPRRHRIEVSQRLLDDTRARIAATRWLPQPPGESGRYGVDLDYLRALLRTWQEEFNWRVWENRLNSYPHFLERIDGLDMHYWYVRGSRGDSIPLMLIHGWPGSVLEYLHLIGPLTDPDSHGATGAPSFDVIVPELPGFGFGGTPTDPGWGQERAALALHTLAHDVLGYDRYAVHGGDWGTLVGSRLARRRPGNVAALQICMPFTGPGPGRDPDPEWLERMDRYSGYLQVQKSVPDALTLGMADSPLGTAAWIIEKFTAWSDHSGDLDAIFPRDLMIANICFYWLTGSIVSATRIYREQELEERVAVGPPRIPVPTSVAVFPREPFRSPRAWLEDVYTVERYTEFGSGGHFASWERPEDVLGEIRQFFPERFGDRP